MSKVRIIIEADNNEMKSNTELMQDVIFTLAKNGADISKVDVMAVKENKEHIQIPSFMQSA